MSFIEQFTVTPNKVRSVYNWLCHKIVEEEDKLKQYMMPEPYRLGDNDGDKHGTIIEPILKECDKMGLVHRQENKITLTEEVQEKRKAIFKRIPCETTTFKLILSDLIFQNSTTEYKGFGTGVSWNLAVNPFEAPKSWPEFEHKIIETGYKEKTGISNDARHGNFEIWCIYLGFGWKHLHYMPDPTKHIQWRIAQIYDSNKEIAITEFIRYMGDLVPVIDGGKYRREITEALHEVANQYYLSTSLSLALRRLEDMEVIKLVQKSDTVTRTLSKECKPFTFSHIKIL